MKLQCIILPARVPFLAAIFTKLSRPSLFALFALLLVTGAADMIDCGAVAIDLYFLCSAVLCYAVFRCATASNIWLVAAFGDFFVDWGFASA
jgi:hypothetical protein